MEEVVSEYVLNIMGTQRTTVRERICSVLFPLPTASMCADKQGSGPDITFFPGRKNLFNRPSTPYYSAQYNCPLEKKWDISLGPRDISQDHLHKTRFMHLYYSYSRPLQEARGSHCHT